MYFVNYYKSKNHKQRYKTKKLLYKVIVKYWKETTKNSLGIKDVLFDCTNLAPLPPYNPTSQCAFSWTIPPIPLRAYVLYRWPPKVKFHEVLISWRHDSNSSYR